VLEYHFKNVIFQAKLLKVKIQTQKVVIYITND